jgi:hypothetical protein
MFVKVVSKQQTPKEIVDYFMKYSHSTDEADKIDIMFLLSNISSVKSYCLMRLKMPSIVNNMEGRGSLWISKKQMQKEKRRID